MRLIPALLFIGAAVVLSGCAGQPPPPGTELPGFWWGLVHGIIAPFALIAEIFTDVRIYEFPNKGGWYDLGFMLGVSSWGGVRLAAAVAVESASARWKNPTSSGWL